MQKKPEDNAGQKGRQRETGEIRADRKEDRAYKVAQSGDHARSERPVEDGGRDDRHKAQADLHVPSADGEKTREHDLHSRKQRKGCESSGVEFGHNGPPLSSSPPFKRAM